MKYGRIASLQFKVIGVEAESMNPTKESTSDAVQVCVRIRPFSGTSNSDGMMSMKSCVRLPDLMNPDQLIIGKDRAFTFDHIYDMQSEQKVCVCLNIHSRSI